LLANSHIFRRTKYNYFELLLLANSEKFCCTAEQNPVNLN
jgi:hypothetical protein